VFIPGVDLPVLTLNQIRMVLWISKAYGLDTDVQRTGARGNVRRGLRFPRAGEAAAQHRTRPG
jgi:uncharacterized protein (DUF697 family)